MRAHQGARDSIGSGAIDDSGEAGYSSGEQFQACGDAELSAATCRCWAAMRSLVMRNATSISAAVGAQAGERRSACLCPAHGLRRMSVTGLVRQGQAVEHTPTHATAPAGASRDDGQAPLYRRSPLRQSETEVIRQWPFPASSVARYMRGYGLGGQCPQPEAGHQCAWCQSSDQVDRLKLPLISFARKNQRPELVGR